MSTNDDDPGVDGGEHSEPSIFDRIKHPVNTAGESTDGSGRSAGGPSIAAGGSGVEKLGTPPHPTDATQDEGTTITIAQPRDDGLDISPGRAAEIDRRAERRSERLVSFWFMASVVGTIGFVAANFVGDKHKQYYTPLLGLTMGLALGGIGIGVILWAKRLMPDEDAVQERHEFKSSDEDIAATEATMAAGYADTGLANRPLVRRTLLGSALALGGLAVVPVLNLYNSKPGTTLNHTQWTKGARIVDQFGNFLKLDSLAIGAIATVFPATPVVAADGTTTYVPKTTVDERAVDATILIRLAPGENRPRKGRENWAYEGHVAYSKICTHAGCPVSLYEQQTHHLLCPCHQSVFDVLDGCRAIFGPASRSLPQLAITVDADGYFIARDGDYTEPIGPAFWERP